MKVELAGNFIWSSGKWAISYKELIIPQMSYSDAALNLNISTFLHYQVQEEIASKEGSSSNRYGSRKKIKSSLLS